MIKNIGKGIMAIADQDQNTEKSSKKASDHGKNANKSGEKVDWKEVDNVVPRIHAIFEHQRRRDAEQDENVVSNQVHTYTHTH